MKIFINSTYFYSLKKWKLQTMFKHIFYLTLPKQKLIKGKINISKFKNGNKSDLSYAEIAKLNKDISDLK